MSAEFATTAKDHKHTQGPTLPGSAL